MKLLCIDIAVCQYFCTLGCKVLSLAFFYIHLQTTIKTSIVHYNSNVLGNLKVVKLLINMDGEKPIYIQIAEWLETEIIDGTLQADDKVYSQYQLAELFNINPATAGKGLTILLDAELIYKKRGLGTFVSADARNKLLTKRKDGTLRRLVQELLNEAALLGLQDEQLIELIQAERKERS
ncbi:GntR family transcriptional regulator [Sporosarcina sp. P26b]|nr:GntR family transcriptional regulator [Sporosarcina sp. P17b]PIC95815.1 GntR family transcriptional regulator [Sporosarcina sp. P26b]